MWPQKTTNPEPSLSHPRGPFLFSPPAGLLLPLRGALSLGLENGGCSQGFLPPERKPLPCKEAAWPGSSGDPSLCTGCLVSLGSRTPLCAQPRAALRRSHPHLILPLVSAPPSFPSQDSTHPPSTSLSSGRGSGSSRVELTPLSPITSLAIASPGLVGLEPGSQKSVGGRRKPGGGPHRAS